MTNPFAAKIKRQTNPFAVKFKQAAPQPKAKVNNKRNPWTAKLKRETIVTGPTTIGYLHPGSAKDDFAEYGIRFTNPRDHGDHWTIDVINGDTVYPFHNRHGAWYLSMTDDRMKEPLQTIAAALQRRYIAELRRIGAELPFSYRTIDDKRVSKKDKKDKSKPNPFAAKLSARRRSH